VCDEVRKEFEKENLNIIAIVVRGKESKKKLDSTKCKLNGKNLIDKFPNSIKSKTQQLKEMNRQ